MAAPSTRDSLASVLREVAAAPAITLPGRPTSQRLPPGTEVAERFEVIAQIGEGGMGVVYLAHDPELDRQVAVKVIPLWRGEVSRALGEARALARLSHPNVVTVHDVGLFDDDHLFIAMEYVAGTTARAWRREAPRGIDEILRVYTAAGEGLATAHDAGLVHRDFKPDNVLVGDDGRVRIADFGLALQASEEAGGRGHRGGGAIAGTLEYMAPEQRAGAAVDARADQFAFCVSLWEAVYGHHPPERGADAARVRGIDAPLLRGLSPDPAKRYPDMRALLAALAAPRARRRRRRLGAALGLGVLGAAALGFSLRAVPGARACAAQGDAASELLTDARREALGATLAHLDPVHGPPVARRFEAGVARWADAWSKASAEACREDPQGPRQRCLRGQLAQVRAVVEGVAEREVDPEDAAEFAVKVESLAYGLPRPANCSRAGELALRAGHVPEALVADLDRLAAYDLVGDIERGPALGRQIVARSESPELAVVRGRALLMLANLQHTAGDYDAAEASATEAFFSARAGADDHGAAGAATKLVWITGMGRGELDEAERWGRHAQSALVGRAADPQLEAAMYAALGVLAEYRGDYGAALAHHDRSLGAALEGYGPEHPNVGNVLNNRGAALDALGRLEEARDTYGQALRVRAAAISTPDILRAMILSNRGLVNMQLEAFDAAEADLRAAVAEAEAVSGPDARPLIDDLLNLGTVLLRAGEAEQALEPLRRAQEIAALRLPPDHLDVALVASTLGEAYLAVGAPDRARSELELALTVASGQQAADPELLRRIEGHLAETR